MSDVKLFKKTDLIIVFILVLIAAAGFFVFRILNSGEGNKVRVTIDGVVFGEYELGNGSSQDEMEFDAVAGGNGYLPGEGKSDLAEAGLKDNTDLEQRIILDGNVGKCVLVIRNGEAYMEEADCPNQICVHHAPIRYKGETIVCLPNRIIIEVID